MNHTTAVRWIRLQDGGRLIGDLWPGSDERQRREILISALWSGRIPMRARFAAKPHRQDGRPELPSLEKHGLLGTTTPLPGIESLLLRTDPRALTCDITNGRLEILATDDKKSWGAVDLELFFPGGATIATGRFLIIELDDIEFDSAAACTYIVENLVPDDAMLSDAAVNSKPLDSATGNVIPFPTGLAGRPTSWHLIEAECRRRFETGERHPNDRTGIESPSKWASVLIAWLRETHQGATVPTKKTLTNRLAGLLRQLAAGAPSMSC